MILKEKENEVFGSIDFINGNKMFLNDSIHNHKPKVGDVIIFPNYLMHTVYPFKSSGERRSFSFNVEIDEKVANVFKKMSDKKQKNVFGEPLEDCSKDPLTGWYRDGCCNTDDKDRGYHTVCAKVNDEFLQWSKKSWK